MIGNALSGWHLVAIVLVVLLLFGSSKLPALAKGLGESVRILRRETTKEDQSQEVPEVADTETNQESMSERRTPNVEQKSSERL